MAKNTKTPANFCDKDASLSPECAWEKTKQGIRPLKNNKVSAIQSEYTSLAHSNNDAVTPEKSPTYVDTTPLARMGLGGGLERLSVQLADTKNDVVVGDTSRINKSHSRKLRAGDIPIDAIVDLHGDTQDQAYKKVHSFIHNAILQKYHKVCIITGKGKGILQNALPEWLNHPDIRPYILTLDIARPEHGGTGAYYVLLKKKK